MNLYQEDFETDPTSAGYADILAKMEKIENDLRKVRKKRKGNKNGRKKKLKKRLKLLEMELQQNPKRAWWQNAVVNALPKILDVASVALQNRSQKIYSSQSPVYLLNDRDKK